MTKPMRADLAERLSIVLLAVGLCGCGQSTAGGAGGSGGSPSQGGATGSGGRSSGALSGGSNAGGSSTGGMAVGGAVPNGSGGAVSAGGTAGDSSPHGTGGSAVNANGGKGSGGSAAGGGSAKAGSTGQGTGGSAGGATTGAAGLASTGGGAGPGGSTGAGGSTGTSVDCAKGQTKGSDVVIIGESFIQLSTIPDQIQKDAVAAGSLKQGDKYINNAVSGMTLAGNNPNSIPNQYAKAVNQYGTIKYVLMDGGGNDCLLNNNGDAALEAAKTLFQTMATDKTEKIQYFFYPDPVGSGRAALKSCLDALRPKMQALCAGLASPKCYWLDLRPTWDGHNEYTSDGIHPTSAGSVATGDAIWKEMVKNCIAQ